MFRFAFLNGNGPRILRLPRWVVMLGLVAAASLGLMILLLAASVALIAVPLLFAAGGVMHWFGRRSDFRSEPVARPPDGQIIDAEYRVIEPGDRR